MEILQNFVAFSEYMNFISSSISLGTVTVLRSIIPLYLVISLSQFVPPMLLVVVEEIENFLDKYFFENVSRRHGFSFNLISSSISLGTVTVLRSIIPLYLVISLSQFVPPMLLVVVEEKEKKIKESMRMVGLRGSVFW